jgi:hypothetical protein
MPAATLTVGNVEITAILDVDTSMPLAEVFGGSGDPPPGGSEFLAARVKGRRPTQYATLEKVRLVILRRDGWRCHWCGSLANQFDHLTPIEGGHR